MPRPGPRDTRSVSGLSTDLSDEGARPYFLWDEATTVGEFRRSLTTRDVPEWCRLVGKLMREARDTDVWRFVRVDEVVSRFDHIRPHLGRRRAFWDYLLAGWKRDGLVA